LKVLGDKAPSLDSLLPPELSIALRKAEAEQKIAAAAAAKLRAKGKV
jgi:hypothetical protein